MSSFDVSVDSVSERWNYRVYLAKPMSMISPVESNSLWRQPAGTRSLVIMMRRICGKSRFWAWSERMSEWLTWLLLHLLFACGCYIAFCNELIAYCLTIGGLTNDVIKCSCCRPQGRTNLSPRRSHRSFEWCLATSAPEPEDTTTKTTTQERVRRWKLAKFSIPWSVSVTAELLTEQVTL